MPSHTIDIHPHVIANDEKRYPLAPLGGHQSDWSGTRPVTYEQLIAAMDAAGVDKAALVQASTCYGYDNSYVAAAVAAYPSRFTGVFSVDVLAPDAVEKMRHWRDRGLTGMRLFTIGSTMETQADWIDDPKVYPAWKAANDLGLPICMQMSQTALPQLIAMVKRFPGVKVILDHVARPVLADGPPYAAAASLFNLAQYPWHSPQGDAPRLHGMSQRQGDAGIFLQEAGRRIRRRADRLGLQLSGFGRSAVQPPGGRPRFGRVAIAGRPGLDFRQDGTVALPRACGQIA
jgi:predicted TIM-barrel fold metal-dependent hydrolase